MQTSLPFVQKTTCVRLSKENLFHLNNVLEIHILNSWRHQKLLLVGNQLQDNTSLFEIYSEGIDFSKLVSQLKLLPSLFEDDTTDMRTIIKIARYVTK